MRETKAERAARIAQVVEYAGFGQRAGREMAEHELYQGHDSPRTGEAVRSLGAANVLGADPASRGAYVEAFAAAYSARFAQS